MTAPVFEQPWSIQPVVEFLGGRRFVALTGAGCSTESGIPDYRSPEAQKRPRNPIQYQQFVRDADMRTRYWARSMVGWPRFSSFEPSASHAAFADMEADGPLIGVITQNVDRLHQRAGSARVIELHGALAEVICLSCGERESRHAFQERLLGLNPSHVSVQGELAPDGDAEVEAGAEFRVPTCRRCLDGVVKPDVVFFGENVPKPRVERAFAMVDEAEAMLVAGSSLATYSGFRFAKHAVQRGIPLVIINIGPTRADAAATLKLEAPLGAALTALSDKLHPR